MERREEGGSNLQQAFFLAFRHGRAACGGQEQGGLGLKGRERSVNQGAAIMRGRWRTFSHTHRAFRHASFFVVLDYGLVAIVLQDW